MKNLFFICTGNTCRSPMAEVIAKSFCKNENLNIFSRGILGNYSPASEFSIQAAFSNGLDLSNHKSKTISEQEISQANIILTMTNEHKDLLLYICPNAKNKIFTIYEYVLNEDKDISDPFGLDLSYYKNCFDELNYLISKIDFDAI